MSLNLLMGLNHLAISLGSKEKVNELTNFLGKKGFKLWENPEQLAMDTMKVLSLIRKEIWLK